MVNSFYNSKASNPNILLKLDLEKVYDRTEWRAAYKILNLMSFPEELIRWIKCCIEEISFSCYFNGEISRKFKSFRGIRQGDPLSPYLFIIMEEAISVMTRDYCSKKRMTPYHIKDTTISHQLFADDIVFAIKGNDKSCKGLKKILENYCAATGQKINREKSEIFFPAKCQPDRKHRICSYFDMKEGSFPMQYLGSLINPRRLNSSHQNRLCEKVNKKVDFWAKQLLSQAGKSTLLNSVVSSIPVYSLSTSWVSEEHYWNYVETKLGVSFSYKETWKDGDWLREDKGYEKESGEKLIAFIANSLWQLWRNRNVMKFKEKTWGIKTMFSYAFEETMQYGGMVGKNRERSGSSMHNRNRYQEDQEGNCNDGCNVFYCDASWKNGNSAGLGYLIAKQGKWVLAGMAKGAADEPMLAEAIAMWYVLDNLRKKGWMNLIVRSDCELLIKMLNGESRSHWKICNLINKISRMKDVGVVCGWEYIKREKNNEAHNLSRLGLTEYLAYARCSSTGTLLLIEPTGLMVVFSLYPHLGQRGVQIVQVHARKGKSMYEQGVEDVEDAFSFFMK
ncbi:hypothetical protein Cni_G14021 [Canna indica]|uniref:Reverse transcriptase domain-containing protein n=1 Tax=Canna indica TaxID=4628 RepID=A0AAQ3QC02_9LILI|nr:hypothetical protein Cni_G14021 [Canna indica]